MKAHIITIGILIGSAALIALGATFPIIILIAFVIGMAFTAYYSILTTVKIFLNE